MASNSKLNRRFAENLRKITFDSYVSRLDNLFHNSVSIENAPEICIDIQSGKTITIPKRYLLGTLLRHGGIAHDKITDTYLRYTKVGIDLIGLPLQYNIYGYNGYTQIRNAEDIDILRANDLEYSIQEYIELQADKLTDIDMAIRQNLDACKTMTIVECENEQQMLTLANMNESRRLGASALYVSKMAYKDTRPLNVMNTGATYLCDKMQELRTQILRETLSNLGFSVSNEDKKERVQSAELTTLNTHGLDAINVLVDTFNYDSDYAGLKIKLKANTELSKQQYNILLDNNIDNTTDNKEV